MYTPARWMTSRAAALGIAVAVAFGAGACSSNLRSDTPQSSPSNSSSPQQGKPAASRGEAPTPKATIEPVLVVASVDTDGRHVSASGYVQGTVQDGKTCTFAFSHEGKSVRMTHEGLANRLTTSCGLVQVPIDQFVRGSWSVTLSYEAEGKTITSAPSTVEIP